MIHRVKTCAAAAACAVAASVVLLPVVAVAQNDGPEDFKKPSAQNIENSVRDLNVENSIRVYSHGEPKGLIAETTEGSEKVLTMASDILFAFGSAVLPGSAPAVIGEGIAAIPQRAAVSVTGHTDSIGDTGANQVLSEQRAQAVAQAIASVRPDLQLAVSGLGETQPVAQNESGGEDNPEGRAQNRRVEVRYTG